MSQEIAYAIQLNVFLPFHILSQFSQPLPTFYPLFIIFSPFPHLFLTRPSLTADISQLLNPDHVHLKFIAFNQQTVSRPRQRLLWSSKSSPCSCSEHLRTGHWWRWRWWRYWQQRQSSNGWKSSFWRWSSAFGVSLCLHPLSLFFRSNLLSCYLPLFLRNFFHTISQTNNLLSPNRLWRCLLKLYHSLNKKVAALNQDLGFRRLSFAVGRDRSPSYIHSLTPTQFASQWNLLAFHISSFPANFHISSFLAFTWVLLRTQGRCWQHLKSS